MARHKSEITGSPLKIATRVTFDQWLEQERLKAERLAEYIRSLGIDPDTL